MPKQITTRSGTQKSLRQELKDILSRPVASGGCRYLDAHASAGTYIVDRHAKNLALSVVHMRYEIDKAAKIATARADFELNRLPNAIRSAEHLQSEINRFLSRAKLYASEPNVVSDIDLHEAYVSKGEEDETSASALANIFDIIASLRIANKELADKFELSRPGPPRSDPLARHFIAALRHKVIGIGADNIYAKSVNSRNGVFIELVVDAWRSLRFGRDSENLDSTFGYRNEFIASNPSEFDDSKYATKLGVRSP